MTVDCIPSAAGQIAGLAVDSLAVAETPVDVPLALQSEIGRASCRERV